MRTRQQVEVELENATSSEKYDKLQAELDEIIKATKIAAARERAEAAAREAREREARNQAFEDSKRQVDELYAQVRAQDDLIYPAVKALWEAVLVRTPLSNRAQSLEAQLVEEAKQLRTVYTPRPPALYGGPQVKPSPSYQLKCWLQRYLDWRVKCEGKPPTLEQVASHGLRGSILEVDVIEPDKNF